MHETIHSIEYPDRGIKIVYELCSFSWTYNFFGHFGCVSSVLLAYSLPNVALKGKATQSSTLSFSDASKAIDGRRNSLYGNGYCSHTAGDETDPWWRVDLWKTFIITSVKVTNRGDCCHERLDGAEIRIGNDPENNGNNNSRCWQECSNLYKVSLVLWPQ